eukprot:CAMPEP_0201504388 /NCGR_PEP_ID=MMETSP0151_2-20130828/85180_1 /ASSEMBLY_ACC=CAM_ASM_000257 /TAXON_ID=200890 /ORGANISM="Paramoeba atlantica, Strain 621/1 / CCAP 1560/9" /LENGTH=427 /DNA_ID=CAMNT_0047898125 /DNA_START=1269 /DNA_END=2549 /DNA_ORIENTATION=-
MKPSPLFSKIPQLKPTPQMVFDPFEPLLKEALSYIEESCDSALSRKGIDSHFLLSSKNRFNIRELKQLYPCRQSLRALNSPEGLESSLNRTKGFIMGRLSEIPIHVFPLLFFPRALSQLEDIFKQIHKHFQSKVEELLVFCEKQIKELEDRFTQYLSPERDVILSRSKMITKTFEKFMISEGFKPNALPANYADVPPKNKAEIIQNLELIRRFMSPSWQEKLYHGIHNTAVDVYQAVEEYFGEISYILDGEWKQYSSISVDDSHLQALQNAIAQLEKSKKVDLAPCSPINTPELIPLNQLIMTSLKVHQIELETCVDLWQFLAPPNSRASPRASPPPTATQPPGPSSVGNPLNMSQDGVPQAQSDKGFQRALSSAHFLSPRTSPRRNPRNAIGMANWQSSANVHQGQGQGSQGQGSQGSPNTLSISD